MWILAAIEAAGGEIGFRRFMEQALYHPEHGYYARNPSPWGRHGDYLTAPTASSWYGDVCGRIIGRAGLSTWPKLFQNLRSTRETELCEEFPDHVVTKWLGNSTAVARMSSRDSPGNPRITWAQTSNPRPRLRAIASTNAL